MSPVFQKPERYRAALKTAAVAGGKLTSFHSVVRPMLAPVDVRHVPHSEGDDAVCVRVLVGPVLDDHDNEVVLLLREQVPEHDAGPVAMFFGVFLAERIDIVPRYVVLHGRQVHIDEVIDIVWSGLAERQDGSQVRHFGPWSFRRRA
jgi:hypothetical protein